MDQASFSLRGIHPPRVISQANSQAKSQAKPQRTGILKALVAVLHLSRRLQAEHVLRQHADLFEKHGELLDLTKLRDF